MDGMQRADIGQATRIAAFVADLRLDDVPQAVRERAKIQMLDVLGVGLAANAYPFAARVVAGLAAIGGAPECGVIGRAERLPLRDAALANGVLMHGLDFDDTHLGSIVHASVASLPAGLSLAERQGASGRDLLTAYIAGMEIAIRIGAAVDGRFHHVGFHMTAIAAHFSAALVAGKLLGLDAAQLVAAQGIAASTAAGVQVFLEEGAWTKRFHPGWAAAAGLTGAHLARHGFKGPTRPYEGRFGLFETHLQQTAGEVEIARLSDGLGERWDLADTAIKPYPVCHFIHGAADAAIALHGEIAGRPIAALRILLPQATLPIVAEPVEEKRHPATDYEAKFSAPFVVAGCLLRGHFGLAELEAEALAAADLQALSGLAVCAADPDSAFPAYFSGGVEVTLADGTRLARHVRVNSGAGERALDIAGASRKFLAAAAMTLPQDACARACETILDVERQPAAALMQALVKIGETA